jgi:hypothetical protein
MASDIWSRSECWTCVPAPATAPVVLVSRSAAVLVPVVVGAVSVDALSSGLISLA